MRVSALAAARASSAATVVLGWPLGYVVSSPFTSMTTSPTRISPSAAASPPGRTAPTTLSLSRDSPRLPPRWLSCSVTCTESHRAGGRAAAVGVAVAAAARAARAAAVGAGGAGAGANLRTIDPSGSLSGSSESSPESCSGDPVVAAIPLAATLLAGGDPAGGDPAGGGCGGGDGGASDGTAGDGTAGDVTTGGVSTVGAAAGGLLTGGVAAGGAAAAGGAPKKVHRVSGGPGDVTVGGAVGGDTEADGDPAGGGPAGGDPAGSVGGSTAGGDTAGGDTADSGRGMAITCGSVVAVATGSREDWICGAGCWPGGGGGTWGKINLQSARMYPKASHSAFCDK